ncbi:MAG: hypothetical protein ACXWIN_03945 [Burkholderiaceae bacterium]
MITLYFLLLLLSLPLWFWLCVRIWKVSPVGAGLSFFLFFPGLYWSYKLWDDQEAKIRTAAYANIALFLLTMLVRLQLPDDWMQRAIGGTQYAQKVKKAEKKRISSDMERWCREQNDATYDPDLKTCVERSKKEALAQGIDKQIFNRLNAHLERSGIKGEFDHSKSGTGIKLASTSEIAEVTSYYFLPFSMSQPRISVLLCVSASACATYIENIKDRSIINTIRNENLILTIPWDSMEDPKIKELTAVFLDFKAG